MNRFARLIAAAALALGFVASSSRPAAAAEGKKKVVFLAGGPSHGFGSHDHFAGCTLLANRLKENAPGFDAVVVKEGWPKDAKVLEGAAAVVIYCDGGPGHLALPRVREMDRLAKAGVGIGMIHYAVEVPADNGGEWWLKWTGGYFEPFWSVNPHWQGTFTSIPQHAATSGVRPFSTHDEWYYNMRFRPEMQGVTPVLTAIPPDSTRQGKDDAHGGNPTVRAAIGKNQPEHVMWLSENKDGSRGFGCTGGHNHWNWAQDDFRKIVLNSIVWIAKGEVPAGGVESKRPTVDELLENQDDPVPANFDKEALAKKIEAMNKPLAGAAASAK